jgi:hypothetical protein
MTPTLAERLLNVDDRHLQVRVEHLQLEFQWTGDSTRRLRLMGEIEIHKAEIARRQVSAAAT